MVPTTNNHDKAAGDHNQDNDKNKNTIVESKTDAEEQGPVTNKAFENYDDDDDGDVGGGKIGQPSPSPSLDQLVEMTRMDTNTRMRMSSYSSKDSFKRR